MDEKKTIRLNKTRKEDFLTWLVNELKPSGWFNSFLATDEEGRNYSVTLQSPFIQGATLEIRATAVNSDGSLSDWGSVIKFQCFQLSNDELRLDIHRVGLFTGGCEDALDPAFRALWPNIWRPFFCSRSQPVSVQRLGNAGGCVRRRGRGHGLAAQARPLLILEALRQVVLVLDLRRHQALAGLFLFLPAQPVMLAQFALGKSRLPSCRRYEAASQPSLLALLKRSVTSAHHRGSFITV